MEEVNRLTKKNSKFYENLKIYKNLNIYEKLKNL